MPHFERSNSYANTRMLVWMTYLNDVTDGAAPAAIKRTFEAKRGRTLIWPWRFHVRMPAWSRRASTST